MRALLFLIIGAFLQPASAFQINPGSEFTSYGKYFDHGGIVWDGEVNEVTIPAGQVHTLTEDKKIYADRLVINGTIQTHGFKLDIFAREIVWGKEGKIEGFEKNTGPQADPVLEPFSDRPDDFADRGDIRRLPLMLRCTPGDKGRTGKRGTDGFKGYDGKGACSSTGAESCKYKKGLSSPIQPMQIFGMRQKLSNKNSQPRIDGTGQKGGDGTDGQKGQQGGKGQKGANGYVWCKGFLGGNNGMRGCRGDRSGPGGEAGLPGFGGRGGIPGKGGPPIQVGYGLGFVSSVDLERPSQKDSKLKGQRNMETFTGGAVGNIGEVGEFGEAGIPGRGGNHMFAKKDWCSKRVKEGFPGPANSKYAVAKERNKLANLFKTKDVYDPGKSLGYTFCKGDDNKCTDYLEKKYSNKQTTKTTFTNFTELSLHRDEVEGEFIAWHWVRQINYYFYSSLYWLNEDSLNRLTRVESKKIEAFAKQLSENNITIDLTRDAQLQKLEEVVTYWKNFFLIPINNLIKNEELTNLQISKLKAAQLIGQKTVEFLQNLPEGFDAGKFSSQNFLIENYLNTYKKTVKKACKKYDMAYSGASFAGNLPEVSKVFEIPSCENVQDLNLFSQIQLRHKIIYTEGTSTKDIIFVKRAYDPSTDTASFNFKGLLNKLNSFLQLIPTAVAQSSVKVELLINKSEITKKNVDKIYRGISKPLSKKGYVLGLSLPSAVALKELPQALSTLVFVPFLEDRGRQ